MNVYNELQYNINTGFAEKNTTLVVFSIPPLQAEGVEPFSLREYLV